MVTQFGKIVGIEGEGLAVLPPWQKLSNFSIRAEQADIEGAEGSTSDTQPIKVSMTVRYTASPPTGLRKYSRNTATTATCRRMSKPRPRKFSRPSRPNTRRQT